MKKIIIIAVSIFTVLTVGTTVIFNSFQSVSPLSLTVSALDTPIATKDLTPVTNPSILESLTKLIPQVKKLLKSDDPHTVTLPSLVKAFALASGPVGMVATTAMIVIEHQLTEINTKLDTITEQLNKISDFQDREFKSRILSLQTKVKDTAKFSDEILDNDDVRLRKLTVLEALESEGTQLLQQINLTIAEEIAKNPTPDFEAYSLLTNDFHTLTEQQNSLIVILDIMSELTFLFEGGAVSPEMCYSIFETYYNQSIATRTALATWHQQQITTFGIDFENGRFDKQGLAALISKIPGIFHDDWNYADLTETLSEQIQKQTAAQPFSTLELKSTLAEDLTIIIQDGGYYYQPTE